MKEKHMRFGDFIRKKRLTSPLGRTMHDVADHLGISLSNLSAVESCNKKPFDGERMEILAKYLEFSEEDTALMFDIASRENNEVPYDIEDIFLHEEIGRLACYALRLSKTGVILEEDWKWFIKRMKERQLV